MDQNLIEHVQMIYQQSQEIEQRIELAEHNINELEGFRLTLEEINNKKEMLAPLGRGVFIESEIKNDKLFVDVGAGILVRKSPEETKKILDEQLTKLGEIRRQLRTGLETMTRELEAILKSESKT